MRWKLLAAIVAITTVSPLAAIASPAPAATPAGVANDNLLGSIEDTVEPLSPKQPRDQREQDHLDAVSLFAAGRVAEQKQDLPKALRLYQRALRRDPGMTPVLRAILPVAFSAERPAEAVRYALLLAEREPTDPLLLQRLAIHLTDQGDFDRAVKFYEKAAELTQKEKPNSAKVLLWLDLGRLSYLTKKYPQAADAFAKVIEALKDPKNFNLEDEVAKAIASEKAQTYQLFAEAFLEAGRAEAAATAFREADQAKPSKGGSAFNLARVDVLNKDYDAALKKLDTAFAERVGNLGVAPYQLLAQVLKEQGKSSELLERLEKIREADKRNLPLNYFLARQYRESGQIDKSEELYRDIIKRRKDRPPLEVYQGLLEIYREQKKTLELFQTLGDAVGRAGSLDALGEAAKVVIDDQQLVKDLLAIAEQRRADASQAKNFGESLTAGLLALEQKQYDLADSYLQAAIDADKSKAPEIVLAWGLDLVLGNQHERAVKVFQRGIDDKFLPADNPAFHFYLSGALAMGGKTDEALQAADKAADLKKDAPRFASRRAWVLYHAKRYKDAKIAYQELIEKYDSQRDSSEVREVMHDARLALSNIAVQLNQLDEAEEWVEQVLDEFPEDIGALNDLGYLWADQGKHLEIAYQMIEKAVAGEPENKAYRDSLGWVLYRLGRHQEAAVELKKALDEKDPDGTVLDHYADALTKSGETPKAIEVWEQAAEALEKNGEHDKVKQVQQKLAEARGTTVKP